MAPVQIKVVYDYYSAKRTTPFFIAEEELLNLDFHSFKSRLPHIAKALRLTMSDENLEVDYDFTLLFLQPIDVVLLKGFLPLFYSRISEEVFDVYCGLVPYWGAPFEHFV